MSSSKRPHTKSRLGCDQCKKRRVKCDFKAPECANCRKRGLQCGYRVWETAVGRLCPSDPNNNSTSEPVARRTTPVPSPPPLSPFFTLYDLDLLHDFTLRASTTVARSHVPLFRDIWQQDVPKLGHDHPYLMHAILSFAAAYRLHLADPGSLPDTKAKQAARDHYDQALVQMRVLVSDITPEVADPLLCFSILICFITMYLGTVDRLGPIEIVLALLRTIRSTMGILLNPIVRKHLAESRVGSLVKHDSAATTIQNGLPDGLSDSLDKILALSSEHSTESASSPEYDRLLSVSAAKLKHMFSLTTSCPKSWDNLLSWPISLFSELPGFVSAIEQHEPRALCILAHWCVPLCNAPPKWFVGNWPRELLGTINMELAGTRWECDLAWAVGQVLHSPREDDA